MTQPSALEPGSDTSTRNSDRETCSNCGSPMAGEYCSVCGQSRRHFLRFFPAVVGDFIAETFEIDGRLSRTLRTLLLQPGKLTNEYIAGRRVHYSPPVRFYLFTSLLAFLLISFEVNKSLDVAISNDSGINFTVGNEGEQPAQAGNSRESDLSADESAMPEQQSEQQPDEQLTRQTQRQSEQSGAATTDAEDDDFLHFNGTAWHPQDNPLVIGFLPATANALLNARIARIKQNIPRIREQPGILVDQFLRYLPQTMLVLLPVFALILKLFYPFARRYYTEHVIFSIHMHSFTLLMVIIIMLLDELTELNPLGWLDVGLDAFSVIALLWVPAYGMLAQKRVYRQGWIMTGIKYTLVYGLYFTVQMLAMVFVVLLGASSL